MGHGKRRLKDRDRRDVGAGHFVSEPVAVEIGIATESLGGLNAVMMVESVVAELTQRHHIAGLVGEKAAAQAALAVRKEADEQIGELFETMAELLADNAALDAKLEAAAEQRKLVEKMAELAAENARLKVHVELAAERAEATRSAMALTLENERLKLHLAALEQKQILAEAARTAAKPRGERKAR